MGWELEIVERPFVEQLQAMRGIYVESNIDGPAPTNSPIVGWLPP
jgi:hypothetical protein